MKQSQSFAVYALLFAVLLLLSGCGQPSTDTTATQQPTQVVSQNSDGSVQVLELVSDTIAYDGEHGVGRGGKSPDTLIVRFSLDEQQIIQTVETTFEAGSPKSSQYQAMFQGAIATEVVGKPLKDLKVAVVRGASTSSEAFNAAVETLQQKITNNG